MEPRDAEKVLEDAEVVPCMEGGFPDVRELVRACLEAEIPALMGAEACAKPGCTPKAQRLGREDDLPRVKDLLRTRWAEMLAREGAQLIAAAPPGGGVEPEGEPPCPACGTAAPLVAGACSDCGLQLE